MMKSLLNKNLVYYLENSSHTRYDKYFNHIKRRSRDLLMINSA